MLGVHAVWESPQQHPAMLPALRAGIRRSTVLLRYHVSTCALSSDKPPTYATEHQAIIPPPSRSGTVVKGWMDAEFEGPVDQQRRIFCNRTLDLGQLQAIGFDMDYTLAQYKPETFENLAYAQTVEKLVKNFGYPAELLELDFDWRYMMRGLTIDKKRGNVLKVDRHKYVKIAYHGLSALSKADRQATYSGGMARLSFDTDDYSTIDTLFSLAEAYLFMQVVDMKDTNAFAKLNEKPYKDLYKDIRGAVDLCHRDGSLKTAVAADPAHYIHKDEKLQTLLDMYRRTNRKVFLATNSLWDYTNVVMNFLVDNKAGSERTTDWLRYFDVVMTGCRKPSFFNQGNLLFAVNPSDSTLTNTDNGAPILPIDQSDLPSSMPASPSVPLNDADTKVFQGGSVSDLHQMLGVTSASSVLYVGDHIYGDILKSKKSMGWRTMLVIPELEMELRHAGLCQQVQEELERLRALRDGLDERIQRLHWHIENIEDEEDLQEWRADLQWLTTERERVGEKHTSKLAAHHAFFHPIWGQMLKSGYQSSMYASLLERFACIYASHVNCLTLYSPYRTFRGRIDVMAHEHQPAALEGPEFSLQEYEEVHVLSSIRRAGSKAPEPAS